MKLEDPKVGDPMRQWGRSKPEGSVALVAGDRPQQEVGHRRPRVHREEGRDIARALIAKADVVVENFRARHPREMGHGLRRIWVFELNPGLVTARECGLRPDGASTPSAAGYALVGEAAGRPAPHHLRELDRNPASGRHLDRRQPVGA
ncbi:CoA transferase [Caulobacter segnis]